MLAHALRHIGLAKDAPGNSLDALIGAGDAGDFDLHWLFPSQKLFRRRAILGVAVTIVGKHLLDDLGLEFSVRTLGELGQIEILDRIAVDVELEVAAQRSELGLPKRGRDGLLVLEVAL